MIDIAPDQHFLRYAKRTHIIEKEGVFTISSSNFLLREDQGEDYLSGAWYEFLRPNSVEDALEKATDFMKTRGFQKINGAFSIHNVVDILAKSNEKISYQVKHLSKCNDAYSGILPQPKTLYDAEAIAETVNSVLKCKTSR